MIDITSANLEADLVQASLTAPVLLDIWAPWCGPCKSLSPVLEKLEVAYAGRFTLAKLNSDEQPEIASQLSQMFGVRSIPFCVMFAGGQPVDGFVGALPEAQIREFLDKHVPSTDEATAADELDEAEELLAEGDTATALERLQDAVAIDPSNDLARYEYLRELLKAGRVEDAQRAFEPVAGKVALDSRFAAVGYWLNAVAKASQARSPAELDAAIAANRRDFDARFELAQSHFAEQRFTEAMEALLEIVMRDKVWSDGLARKTYVAILELMTKQAPKAEVAAPIKGTLEVAPAAPAPSNDPVVDQYRRKLSMALN
ncbi:MAG: co-chaperone YbbN [Rhizobacter sp.]|nr:co-chaperone YbbN [Rhizobacter sp.]